MVDITKQPLMERIVDSRETLTPKDGVLGDFVLENPRKVVFMTSKELAAACQVSEATVVRFVAQLQYGSFSEFIQALRDLADTELTLLDRFSMMEANGAKPDRFRKLVLTEIDNLRTLFESIEMETTDRVLSLIQEAPAVYVIGSRLSHALSYYLGWALTKVRPHISILKGSDSTTVDWLTIAPAGSLAVIIATSRYPNELIRMGKLVRRLGLTLVTITDSAVCPLIQFAHESLVAPSKSIPVIGNPMAISCLLNYLVLELMQRYGEETKKHQGILERSYLENDVMFNPHISTSS